MSRKPAIFVLGPEPENVRYVLLAAVMNPLCAMFDGLPTTTFGKSTKHPYMTIEAAIEWTKKEAASYRSGAMFDKLTKQLANLELAAKKDWVDTAARTR